MYLSNIDLIINEKTRDSLRDAIIDYNKKYYNTENSKKIIENRNRALEYLKNNEDNEKVSSLAGYKNEDWSALSYNKKIANIIDDINKEEKYLDSQLSIKENYDLLLNNTIDKLMFNFIWFDDMINKKGLMATYYISSFKNLPIDFVNKYLNNEIDKQTAADDKNKITTFLEGEIELDIVNIRYYDNFIMKSIDLPCRYIKAAYGEQYIKFFENAIDSCDKFILKSMEDYNNDGFSVGADTNRYITNAFKSQNIQKLYSFLKLNEKNEISNEIEISKRAIIFKITESNRLSKRQIYILNLISNEIKLTIPDFAAYNFSSTKIKIIEVNRETLFFDIQTQTFKMLTDKKKIKTVNISDVNKFINEYIKYKKKTDSNKALLSIIEENDISELKEKGIVLNIQTGQVFASILKGKSYKLYEVNPSYALQILKSKEKDANSILLSITEIERSKLFDFFNSDFK